MGTERVRRPMNGVVLPDLLGDSGANSLLQTADIRAENERFARGGHRVWGRHCQWRPPMRSAFSYLPHNRKPVFHIRLPSRTRGLT